MLDVQDSALRHCLGFGIGLHHAGLCDGDRTIVERLYVSVKIQASMRMRSTFMHAALPDVI